MKKLKIFTIFMAVFAMLVAPALADTIDQTASGAGTVMPSSFGNGFYRMTKIIDFADVLTEKESALAAADIIQVFDIPKRHAVLAATINPITVGDSTTATLDLVFTTLPEADPDNFVDGYDAIQVASSGVPIFNVEGYALDSATTVDMVIKTLSGTLATGKVRVTAIIWDMR